MDFLEEELEEILNIFREESEEHLQKLNQNLLRLEANPKDSSAISELFREAHSLKGAARMIGLNDIQALAHKIEDIFGLAKESSIKITPEIIDVLCKAVDCINSIIEESIQTRGECHSVNVDKIIQQIENIKESTNQGESKQQNAEIHDKERKSNEYGELNDQANLDKLKNLEAFLNDVSPLISQIKKIIKKLKKSPMNSDIISDLYNRINYVDTQAQTIEIYEIKDTIQDIKIKLDGVVKGSGILIDPEVEEIEETFNNFVGNIEKVKPSVNAALLSISQDKPVVAKVIIDEEIPEQNINTEPDMHQISDINLEHNNDFQADLDFISKNLFALSNNLPDVQETIDLLIEKLSVVINHDIDPVIRKILDKLAEIILFSKTTGIKPSIEINDVIKQAFDTAQLMLLTSSDSVNEDPDLLLQRLAILLQMLKLSDQEPTKLEEDTNSAIIDAQISQKTDMLLSEPDSNSKNQFTDSKATSDATIKTLRVDTRKLDQLVSQVGELIIAKIKSKEHQAEVERITRDIEDWHREWNKAKKIIKYIDKKPAKSGDLSPGVSVYSQNKNIHTFFEDSSLRLVNLMNQMNTLYKIIQEDDTRLSLIVNELEERIKSVRVLPLATIFHMFPRMVRDISREKGKDIELVISGSETSVDKKIIEEIKSPLIHIIRNAIDHGIEDPETRINKGKNPTGKILLSAHHLENSVLIEVIDDGRGIDLDVIKKKVLQKGLLTPTELQAMSDDQIMNIIFWPGFSTGDVVTDISGRGIGLDIVYTKITQLNGKVNIKSTLGQGCRVSIQLPVTMATVKAFLVKANNQAFAIPTSAIKTALLIKHKDVFYKEGRETIIVDNKTVPICRLSRILEMPDQKLNEDKIVVIVIQAEDVQVGFIIDKLLGDQEILHKNLTPPLLRVRNVAGVTTLASGELCLILNVSDLVKSAYLNFGMTRKELIINRENSANIISKMNILVVDDSVTTRILERNILRAAGYNVTVAVNGLDALTKILSEKFDLIVTDVEMPEINGFELTERLKRDDKFKDIPIILVTSLASEADRKRGLNIGANAYITKGGFDQEELLATISKLLNI